MTEPESSKPGSEADKPPRAIAAAILDLVSAIPGTTEVQSATPSERARAIQVAAARKAAVVSGALALPPGPAGIITILPDLVAVWRIQAQMVADIAAVFGKSSRLGQEQMLYCLFRHAAAQVVRDLTARIGERVVFRQATLRALQLIAAKLGIKVTQRVIAKTAARFLPVVGSLGVAAYAYYDTTQVGATAQALFSAEIGASDETKTRS